MQLPELDLLGDPNPAPLPEGIQLTSFDQLVGHTILAAIEDGGGQYQADLVFVTQTHCWLIINGDVDGCGDDAPVVHRVVQPRPSYSSQPPYVLHDFVCAAMLYAEGCINLTERDALLAVEDKRTKAEAAERASQLRAQLERAEREAGLVPQSASNGST